AVVSGRSQVLGEFRMAGMVPVVDPMGVASREPSDYLTRFVFGGGISLVAGVIGMAFGGVVGGVLLGFPGILPASLTLIEKKEGKEEASVDSIGADRKSTRLNSSHLGISYAVFCL